MSDNRRLTCDQNLIETSLLYCTEPNKRLCSKETVNSLESVKSQNNYITIRLCRIHFMFFSEQMKMIGGEIGLRCGVKYASKRR